ncbi:FAD-dependent monooxygenase, partial [Amycolatopsis sp. cmx-4-68]|uniref:FAD-dependent monooxygenase n=1 Tax=Amycolatopsis sp. cmx-4-68 TaxID=2790938 RepID=UPI00397D8B9E
DLRNWVDDWNAHPKPFVWTKTAEEIISKLGRLCERISRSGHYDVVVAGGGPVGLLLAGELERGGARVLVLEREAEPPRSRAGSMGARSLNMPSVHALHLRGLLPAVERAAAMWLGSVPASPPPSAAGEPIFVGQFAGIAIRADRLRSPAPGEEFLGAGVIAQADLEAIFRDALGDVEVRRGTALTGFAADAGGVTVRFGHDEVRAGWLVGADGGRSTVRRLAGFAFPGVDPIFTGRQAVVDLDAPEKLTAGGWQHGEHGSYVVGGWADGGGPPRVHTVEYEVPPADRDAPVTAAEMQASLRRVSGTDVVVTRVHVGTRYADTTRQATTYRRGRVLLCGDAAHVHSPAGGQGLNLGLGDAVNLGWKLALVARGHAPESLLDTYTAERHPIGEWVQRWSLAQTALIETRGPRTAALREVLADLLDTPDGATHVVSSIAGGWQHYDLPGDHPLIGHRAPDLPLDDGTTLASHFREGHAVLLDAGTGVATAAEEWGSRVRVVRARPLAYADQPLAALVRPDGYVAWIAVGAADEEGLRAAMTRWLGQAGR